MLKVYTSNLYNAHLVCIHNPGRRPPVNIAMLAKYNNSISHAIIMCISLNDVNDINLIVINYE